MIDELIVDSFAGGGGASLGIQWATGKSPDVAINHDEAAIVMHAAKFWKRVRRGPGCWIWLGVLQRRRNGAESYGLFSLGRRGSRVLAHRFSYALVHGPIAVGQVVRHGCDNPKCVRPDHLEAGTQAQNLADMRERGRAHYNRFPNGSDHPNSKINAKKVLEIRRLRKSGLSVAKIGKKIGLHGSTVHDIVTRKTWGHVQ